MPGRPSLIRRRLAPGVDTFIQLTLDALTLGQRLRADRARLHARLRRPQAPQLRPRRRLHGRLVHRLRRPAGARRHGEPGRAGLAAAHPDHARRDGRLRGARRRDRALRLPAAARRAAHRAADQRARRLVLPRELDAAAVRRAAAQLRHRSTLDGGSLYLKGFDIGNVHVPLLRIITIVVGVRADDRALVPRQPDAHRQGDARDVVRPRGGGDDGHRHRPRDRLHVRARLGARRRGRRDVRAARADARLDRLRRRPEGLHGRRDRRHRLDPRRDGRRPDPRLRRGVHRRATDDAAGPTSSSSPS